MAMWRSLSGDIAVMLSLAFLVGLCVGAMLVRAWQGPQNSYMQAVQAWWTLSVTHRMQVLHLNQMLSLLPGSLNIAPPTDLVALATSITAVAMAYKGGNLSLVRYQPPERPTHP